MCEAKIIIKSETPLSHLSVKDAKGERLLGTAELLTLDRRGRPAPRHQLPLRYSESPGDGCVLCALFVCKYVCMYICMYVVCMLYVCMYVCMYPCIHVWVDVHVNVFVNMYLYEDM